MYKLVVLQGPVQKKEFKLRKGTYLIGRSADCDIFLESNFISKKHAAITLTADQIFIEDLNSRNGTFVNGIMIQKMKLNVGDRISFHDIILEFRVAKSPKTASDKSLPFPSSQPPIAAPFQKITSIQKTFLPLFEKITQRLEWKYVTIILISLFIGSSFVALVPPLMSKTKTQLKMEALKRGEFIVKRIAKENQKYLKFKQGSLVTDSLKLSTALAQSEERILSINIVDPKTKRILAPTERLNQTVENIGAILQGTEVKKLNVQELTPNVILISHPIAVASPAEEQEEIGAVVQAVFNLEGIGFSDSEYIGILIRSAMILVLLGIVFYILLTQSTSAALRKIESEIETATRKGYRPVELHTKFDEISQVIRSINKVFKRTRDLVAQLPEESRGQDEKVIENSDEILKSLVESLPEGVIVLNDSYQIIKVNPAFQKIAGFKYDFSTDQNILDVIRDQELLRNISHGLGQAAQGMPVREDLFINQKKFELSVSATKNLNNQIDFYILNLRQAERE